MDIIVENLSVAGSAVCDSVPDTDRLYRKRTTPANAVLCPGFGILL